MEDELTMEGFLSSEEDYSLVLDNDDDEVTNLSEIVEKKEVEKDNNEDDSLSNKLEDDKKIKAPDPKPDKSDASSKTNIYSSLVKGFVDEGVLKNEGVSEIKDFNGLSEALNSEFEARIQERLSELEPDKKFWAEKKKLGYSSDEIYNQMQTTAYYDSITVDDINDDTEEGEALRKQILTGYYKAKGLSDVQVEKTVSRIIDSGEDKDEAIGNFNESKLAAIDNQNLEDEKKANDAKDSAKKRKDSIDNLKKFSDDTKEIIPGVVIPNKIRSEIFDGMTKPVSKTKDGSPLDIVGDFLYSGSTEDRYKLSYILKVTNGLKDLDNLSMKKGKSKAIEEVENALRKQDVNEFQYSGLDELSGIDIENMELIVD